MKCHGSLNSTYTISQAGWTLEEVLLGRLEIGCWGEERT